MHCTYCVMDYMKISLYFIPDCSLSLVCFSLVRGETGWEPITLIESSFLASLWHHPLSNLPPSYSSCPPPAIHHTPPRASVPGFQGYRVSLIAGKAQMTWVYGTMASPKARGADFTDWDWTAFPHKSRLRERSSNSLSSTVRQWICSLSSVTRTRCHDTGPVISLCSCTVPIIGVP